MALQGWTVADVPLHLGQEMVKSFHYARGGSNTRTYMHGLIDPEGTHQQMLDLGAECIGSFSKLKFKKVL